MLLHQSLHSELGGNREVVSLLDVPLRHSIHQGISNVEQHDGGVVAVDARLGCVALGNQASESLVVVGVAHSTHEIACVNRVDSFGDTSQFCNRASRCHCCVLDWPRDIECVGIAIGRLDHPTLHVGQCRRHGWRAGLAVANAQLPEPLLETEEANTDASVVGLDTALQRVEQLGKRGTQQEAGHQLECFPHRR